jgi:exosortase E/protease (VPEID-CTERM system)
MIESSTEPERIEARSPALRQMFAYASALVAGAVGSFAWLASLIHDGTTSAFAETARDAFDFVVYGLTGFAAAILAATRGMPVGGARDFFVFDGHMARWIAVHIVLVCALVALYFATPALSAVLQPAALFGLCLLVGAAAIISLAYAIARGRQWLDLAVRERGLLAAAAGAGLAVALLAFAAQTSWPALSAFTFHFVRAILSLFYRDIFYDVDERLIGVNEFGVLIDDPCSGMEGIALISAFCLGYLFLFRRTLRFPAALLILPIGIAVIWILNGVRIAALIGIGDKVSPEAAVFAFHSYAGWLMFLIASVGLIVLTHSTRFLSLPPIPQTADAQGASRDEASLATAQLAPFGALLFVTLLAQTFSWNDIWTSAAKAAVGAAALWLFRANYRGLLRLPGWPAVAAGVVVGLAWFATNPAPTPASLAFAEQVEELGAVTFFTWLALKLIAFAAIVPLAEELAFRGYLTRALEGEGKAPVVRLCLSLVATSALFGVLHERWLAGALAGACYWLLAHWRGRLIDAVAAHAVTNATILVAAVLMQSWTSL